MKEYKVDKELKTFMPELTEDELKKMEESFRLYGYKGAPIFVWKEKDIIIDGHNRFEICKKLGCEPVIEKLSFESREEVIQWIIYTQLGRRNLPDGEKVYYARMLRPKLEKEAKEKQRKAGGDRRSQKYIELNTPQNGVNDRHKNEVTSQLAEMVGMKREKFRMAESVLNSDNEELKMDMRTGKKTISRAYKELKKPDQDEEFAKELVEEKTKSVNASGVVLGENITEPKQKMGMEEGFAYLKEQFARINEFILPNKKYLRDKKVKYYDKYGLDITDSARSDIYFHFNDLNALCSLIASMELEECGDTIAISINKR